MFGPLTSFFRYQRGNNMRRLTNEEFIRRAMLVHGDTYDYSEVEYCDMNSPVKIVCKKHGSFFQSPNNHLKGAGCSICNKIESRQLGVDEFIRRALLVHGDMYDYSRVIYKNTKTPVEIICAKHGSFFQKPEKHLVGHGCPLCVKNHKDDKESFILKARRVHGNLYDYSLVHYVNQKVKVCILDPKYGAFWQSPCGHLNGEGCPKRRCTKYSKPQLEMVSALRRKFGDDDVIEEYKSDTYPYKVDAYVKSLDLYIELNAFWTHGGHYFDDTSLEDVSLLHIWQTKSSSIYKTAICTWTVTDLQKRDVAISKNLNYLVFWDNDLTDFYDWYNSF